MEKNKLHNRSIFIIAALTLLFCTLYIFITKSNILSYDNPDGTGDVSKISYASQKLSESSADFTVKYAAWDLAKLGLRFYLDDDPGKGDITVTISDSKGVVGTQSCSYSNAVSNELTWFVFNKKVTAGDLNIAIKASGDSGVGVSVYTDGNDTENSQSYLESHFTAIQYSKKNLYCISIAMLLMVTGLFFVAKKQKWNYTHMFILCWTVIGFFYYLVLPILAEPDAGNHFRRIYTILQGNILPAVNSQGDIGAFFSWPDNWSKNDSVQISLYQQLNNWTFQIKNNAATYISYKNMALYSPLCYLPQIAGMLLGKLITKQLIAVICMARMINYICTGMVMYFAVRITPFGKKYLLWMSLLPMVMELSVGIAPDSMVIALISLLTAAVMKLRYTKEMMNKKYIFGFALISFLLSQYKIVYVVSCFLLFLIPKEKFASREKYYQAVAGIGSITAIPALIWLYISTHILKSGYASSAANAEIFMHPVKFAMILFRTVMEKGGDYIQQAMGSNMGAMSFGTNALIMLMLFAFLCFSLGIERKGEEDQEVLCRDRKWKYMLTGVILITSILIFAAEYVQWTAAGSSVIDGVQGRYFLPMLFPLMLLIGGNSRDDVPDYNGLYAFMSINLCFITQLMTHYLFLGNG